MWKFVFIPGERPYVCDECGVSYAYPNILRKHKKSKHEQVRPNVCHICDKRFTMKAQLNAHLFTHTGERPYACDQCDKAFNRPSTLKTHKQSVHQRIRSYTCLICNKAFSSAGGLSIHSLTHTGAHLCVLLTQNIYSNRTKANQKFVFHCIGERPHACDQCDRLFSQRTSLKLHKNSVHQQIRPHACPHCDKRFKTTSHLKQHSTIHTGILCLKYNDYVKNLSKSQYQTQHHY